MVRAKQLAVCSMMTALCVVLMALGMVLELGTYAAPMFASLCLIPVREKYGKRWQVLIWIAAALLCFLLLPVPEQNLMFFGLFGWYPILRPSFQKMPRMLRIPAKFLAMNAAMIAIEALVMLVLVPEVMGTAMLLVFLALMNVLFLCFDFLLDRLHPLFCHLTKYL